MTINLDQFRDTYFEECSEGLDIMEHGLMALLQDDTDTETIHSVFRAAHSIKGGAGTFGFDAVGSLTHLMETVLDEARNATRELDDDQIDILLRVTDCLRKEFDSVRDQLDPPAELHAECERELHTLLATAAISGAPEIREACRADSATPDVSTHADAPAPESRPGALEIHFVPDSAFYRTGNDPAGLFAALRLLGELSIVECDIRLPEWSLFDPTECYLSWQLRIEGPTEEEVLEVFEWVTDDCELEISKTYDSDATPDAETPRDPSDPNAIFPVSIPDAGPLSSDGDSNGQAEKPATATPPGNSGSLRVNIDKIDDLINIVGELVITQSMLGPLVKDPNGPDLRKLRTGVDQLERNTRDLQERVMHIRMVPVATIFSRLPRVVRDTAKRVQKQVRLEVTGESTEIDKTILERLTDPLVHLVRNAVDHGMETPEQRIEAGKPPEGCIALRAFQHGGDVVIEIEDDGQGIDTEAVRQRAIDRGWIEPDESITDQQAYDFLFQPGFSTAATISDISGRGVGLDVVKQNIVGLGGTIDVSSQSGKGTRITTRLPLTVAILDGQTIVVGSERYLLSLASIIETIQLKPSEVFALPNGHDVFRLRDGYYRLIRLDELLGCEPAASTLEEGLVVVVEGAGQRIGLFVDSLLAQQQIVIKSLETNYRRVPGIAAATILGDGSVALILDAGALVRMTLADGTPDQTELPA